MARRSVDPDQRKALFHRAIELGIDTFDTAPLYGFGDTELLLGDVLSQHREAGIRVLTKVGLRWSPDSRGAVHFQIADGAAGTRVIRRDSRPEAVRQDVEDSLRRLRVDVLDLVQVHFRDPGTPIDETMGALAALRQEGKLREIGVSNFTLDEVRTARQALGDVPLAAVQLRLNLLQRDPLLPSGIVPWCVANGVGVLAYSPLAEGRLAGMKEVERSVRSAIAGLSELAENSKSSAAQLALGWLVNHPGVSSVVLGASKHEHLIEAVEAVNRLPVQTLDMVEKVARRARLPEPWERSLLRRLINRFTK